jgi:hypothetical protein
VRRFREAYLLASLAATSLLSSAGRHRPYLAKSWPGVVEIGTELGGLRSALAGECVDRRPPSWRRRLDFEMRWND